MANNKHLSLSDRITIESMLEKHHTFKEIGSFLDKNPTTISKEIRSRFVTLRTGCRYIQYNNCQLRFSCSKKHLCHPCHSSRKFKLCRTVEPRTPRDPDAGNPDLSVCDQQCKMAGCKNIPFYTDEYIWL